jgi:hypothetical protein
MRPKASTESTSMERPRLSFFQVGAHRLPKILRQVQFHRIGMSGDLPLEDVHEVTPRADNGSDAKRWMTCNALRELTSDVRMLPPRSGRELTFYICQDALNRVSMVAVFVGLFASNRLKIMKFRAGNCPRCSTAIP